MNFQKRERFSGSPGIPRSKQKVILFAADLQVSLLGKYINEQTIFPGVADFAIGLKTCKFQSF